MTTSTISPESFPDPVVWALATLGQGSNEEARIRDLLAAFHPVVFPFDRARKFASFCSLFRRIRAERPDLIVMEGTGLAGGAAAMLGRLLYGVRYVISSGDAVGPWIGGHVRCLGPLFAVYERALCRLAAGFIGWTPYLAGRALTFGTPRVMTAPGWAPFRRSLDEQAVERRQTRERLGIPASQIVVGIAGSMVWSRRYGYCYGMELVEAARKVRRTDVTFLLVGDGIGRPQLEAKAAVLPAGRVIFTGRVPQDKLPAYYAACDLASLPQSVDRVGSFRYTTKLSEYLAFGLPVLTGQIPLAYDLDDGWIWRLAGDSPWDQTYTTALAGVVDGLTADELQVKRAAVPRDHPAFDYSRQARQVAGFVDDLLNRARKRTT